MNRTRLTALCLALMNIPILSIQSLAEPRLIELGLGKRVWMTKSEVKELVQKNHLNGGCGGFLDVTHSADFFPLSFEEPSSLFLDPLADGIEPGSPVDQTILKLLPLVQGPNIMANVEKFSSYDRDFDTTEGMQAALWLEGQFKKYSANRSDISIREEKHDFLQPSIVATIQGKSKPDEIVILGAHIDSINLRDGGRAPGADDDASGVATLLEAFRILAETGYQPDRTIEFMGYAGEEQGLYGSQDIAGSYKSAKKNVVGVIQFDMTMFAPLGRGKSEIAFITDYVNPALTQFTQNLVDQYVKIPWTKSKCNYGCSDHFSWTRRGYASAFPIEAPFEKDNKAIHSSQDVIALLDESQGVHFVKIALAFSVALGNGSSP